MRKLATTTCVVVGLVLVLASAAVGHPDYWNWGYNYLSGTTDGGVCYYVDPYNEIGEVCSNSDLARDIFMDKRNGGRVHNGLWRISTYSLRGVYVEGGPLYSFIDNPTVLGWPRNENYRAQATTNIYTPRSYLFVDSWAHQ